MNLPILHITYEKNHTSDLLCLASFTLYINVMFSSFLQIVVYVVVCSFLCLSNDPYVYVWMFGLFPLWGHYKQCCNIYSHRRFCRDMFSLLLSTYVEVVSLDHRVILCLTFLGTTKLFATATVPFYIPTSNV